MTDTIELCHCGRPIFINDAIEPGYTRGMCEDCDSLRCDVDPRNCEDPRELTVRAAMRVLLNRWYENAHEGVRNAPEGFCRLHAEDLEQAGLLVEQRREPIKQRESWVNLNETCVCGAELKISGTAAQVRAMSIVFGTHHNEQTCSDSRTNILYSSSGRMELDSPNIEEL